MTWVLGATETPSTPSLYTPFTIIHFLYGMISFVILRWLIPHAPIIYDFALMIILHTIYEARDVSKIDSKNSWLNSLGDTIAAIFGFGIMALLFPNRKFGIVDILVIGGIYIFAATLIDEPNG